MNKLPLAILAAAAVSCSGDPEVKEQAPRPGTVWRDMTHPERLSYMTHTVFPDMKAEFMAFDREAFKGMTCATCHGGGAKDRSFLMPNPELPKLPTTDAGMKKVREDCPGLFDFMANRVVPRMASLLGEAPYDPKTRQGFHCFRCHTRAEAETY